MAEDNKNPPAGQTPSGGATAVKAAPKVGDEINVVGARGKEKYRGKITKLLKDGFANLSVLHPSGEMTITSSPHDPEGKTPDSWHVPAAE